MKQDDPCRFCRIYAIAVVAFAALLGAVTTLQFMLSAQEHLRAYACQFVIKAVVRSTGPAVSGTALLLAFVLWAHPLAASTLLQERTRIIKRAMAVAVPGYLVAVLVSALFGFLVATAGFGQGLGFFARGFGIIGWRDYGVGVVGTLLDAVLITFLARRYLVRLQSGGLSLPAKLIVTVTVSVGLRTTVALIFASLVSD